MANVDVDDNYTETSLPESEDLGNDFDKDLLTCSICFEYFNQPKTLNCQHTFCQACLQRLLQNQQNPEGVDNLAPATLPCPTCRKPSPIPDTGIEGFPNDFKVEKLKEALKYAKSLYKSRLHLCDICEQNKSFPLATEFCLHCRKHLCQSCFKKHQNTSLFRNHLTCNLRVEPVQKLCENHQTPREQVEYWCQKCSELVCTFCVIREHAGHELMDLEMASTAKKNYIQDCLSEIDHHLPIFDINVKKLERCLQVLSQKYEKLCGIIKSEAAEIVKQVREREQELLNQVETTYRSECDLLDGKIEDLNYEKDFFNSLKNELYDIDTDDVCNFLTTGIHVPMGRIKKVERDLSVDPAGTFLQSTKILKLEYHVPELRENYLGSVTMVTASDVNQQSESESTVGLDTLPSLMSFTLGEIDKNDKDPDRISTTENVMSETDLGLTCDGSKSPPYQNPSTADDLYGDSENNLFPSDSDMSWMKVLKLQLDRRGHAGPETIPSHFDF